MERDLWDFRYVLHADVADFAHESELLAEFLLLAFRKLNIVCVRADHAILVIALLGVKAAAFSGQPPVAASRGLHAFELGNARSLVDERNRHWAAIQSERVRQLLLNLLVICHFFLGKHGTGGRTISANA